MATILQDKHRGNDDRNERWGRLERADLCARYSELQAQGVSQRQAAQVLSVPRSTLQAWHMYQESLDACPAVVTFFHSVPARPRLPASPGPCSNSRRGLQPNIYCDRQFGFS